MGECSVFVGETYANAISRHCSSRGLNHLNILQAVEYLSRPVQSKFPWLGGLKFPTFVHVGFPLVDEPSTEVWASVGSAFADAERSLLSNLLGLSYTGPRWSHDTVFSGRLVAFKTAGAATEHPGS